MSGGFSDEPNPLVLFQQPNFSKHLNMGQGALNVVFRQLKIQFSILAYGELINLLVNVKVFLPEFHFVVIN